MIKDQILTKRMEFFKNCPCKLLSKKSANTSQNGINLRVERFCFKELAHPLARVLFWKADDRNRHLSVCRSKVELGPASCGQREEREGDDVGANGRERPSARCGRRRCACDVCAVSIGDPVDEAFFRGHPRRRT